MYPNKRIISPIAYALIHAVHDSISLWAYAIRPYKLLFLRFLSFLNDK